MHSDRVSILGGYSVFPSLGQKHGRWVVFSMEEGLEMIVMPTEKFNCDKDWHCCKKFVLFLLSTFSLKE